MLNFAQRLEQHLSGCDNLPEQAIRPQLRRPPWKRAGARSHSMGRELRAHFITFKDPRYKSDRARCQHCLAEVCYPLRSLERHIAECEHFTEGITRPQSRKLLPEDKPIAKKKPVLVAEAREIRSHFMSLDEHTFRMPRLQCRYCKSDVRDHLLNLENHISTCKSLPGSVSRPTKLVQCQGCHRGRIPEHELATHIEDCPTKYCRHCNEFIPRAEMGRHATSCAYYRCEFCWLKMLRQEIKAHITDCPVCRKCRSLKGEPPHICTRTACGRCRQRIPAEVFETHVSACQWLPCPACLRSFESEVDLADHFQLCAEKARLARFEKAEHRIANPRRRLMNKLRQEVKDDAHTTMENSKKSHQSLSALLLSPTTHYPETPEICAVRDAWMNNPYTTVVVDFEYIPSLAAVLKHQSVFQMAFSNAKGEWIVPPTMINHDMSVLELVEQFESALYSPGRKVSTKKEKSNKAMCVAMVAKFYGPPSDSQTKGLTWEEIANIIDHYARKHGKPKVFIVWGKNYGDYRSLSYGLNKAGRGDLLPSPPRWGERPVAWWTAVTDGLSVHMNKRALALGNLYQSIFPEDNSLARRWHHAGADVQMTVRLVDAYFRRLSRISLYGKIESFYSQVGESGSST